MARNLPDEVSSPDDLQLLILEVKKVIDLSHEQALRRAAPGRLPELDLSSPLQDLLKLKSGDPVPAIPQLEELQKWLEEVKTTAPQLYVTLPGIPGLKQKSEIVLWFRREIHPLALIFFEHNRSLAGGFVVRSGSQLFDYSFRHALLNRSDAMVKVMKNV